MITWHALPLVQDPFGNYVVQYVLDLGDINYTDTLVRCFLEHVCDLSVQKFSSNVIEKVKYIYIDFIDITLFIYELRTVEE